MIAHKTFKFSAGHHLPGHNGKCARPHGHNYAVEVAVEGIPRPEADASDYAMVMDFDEITYHMKELLDVVDHYDLNEVLPIKRTTAELIGMWFVWELLARDVPISYVSVDETDNCSATVTEEDLDPRFFTDGRNLPV